MSCLNDETLVALAEGELDPQRRFDALRHVDACPTCAALMGAAARLAGGEELDLGRYELVEEVGAGGMGRVFLAWDPALERDVAVKVVAADALDPKRGTMRLVGEAKALARLNHPAIVKVFDVVERDGSVFIAMEFLRGRTLGGWLARGPGQDEIARVFATAGAALAAAHDAGLIHRDFKPANVIVRDDGEPVVVDFGLARSWEADASVSEGIGRDRRTTAFAGTPVYMAPEQYSGMASAASDQYAFCLTYLEAMARRFPFDIDDMAALRRAKQRRSLCEGVLDGVPSRARQVLLRGLEPDPSRRWPSMRAALAALRPRERRALVLGAGVGGAALVAGALALTQSDGVDCSRAAGRVTEVWNTERADALRVAFEGVGAARVGARFIDDVGGRAAALGDGYRGACQARHVDDVLDDATFDERVRCYDRQVRRIAAALSAAERLEPAEADRAVSLLEGEPDPDRCTDPQFLAAAGEGPSDPQTAASVEAIEDAIARGRMEVRLARYREAAPILEDALAQARTIDHEPTLALATTQLAICLRKLDDPRAKDLAIEGHRQARLVGDYANAVKAALELVHISRRRGRLTEAAQWAEEAAADAERTGSRRSKARVLEARGSIALRTNDFEEADRLNAEVLRIFAETEPDSRAYATTLTERAVIRRRQERFDAALEDLHAAEAILTRLYGADSATLTIVVGELGSVHALMGEVDKALPYRRRAYELAVRKAGPHSRVAFTGRVGLGMGLRQTGRYAEAEAELRGALAVLDKIQHGPREAGLGWVALGKVLALQDKYNAAYDAFDRALGLFGAMEESATRTDLTGMTLEQLGSVETARGNEAEAKAFRERARELGQPI